MKIRNFLIFVTIISSIFTFQQIVFADSCDNLEENPQWLEIFEDLSLAVEAEQYDRALEHSEKMQMICPRAPVLNYIIASCYDRLGDSAKALLFYKKASEYTEEFSVKPHLAQKIWFARFERERAESKQSDEKPAVAAPVIESARVEELEKNIKEEAFTLRTTTSQQSDLELSKSAYKSMFWTGIGTGIAGLALVSTGAVMIALTNSQPVVVEQKDDYMHFGVNKKRELAWSILGVGLGLSVFGSIFAGYGAFHHKRKINEEQEISLQIYPSQVSVLVAF